MAEPKAVKTLAGQGVSAKALSYDPPATPLDPFKMAQQILQLQNTVNELISLFNAHKHTENTAEAYTRNAETGVPKTLITGAGVAATNLFTAS